MEGDQDKMGIVKSKMISTWDLWLMSNNRGRFYVQAASPDMIGRTLGLTSRLLTLNQAENLYHKINTVANIKRYLRR